MIPGSDMPGSRYCCDVSADGGVCCCDDEHVVFFVPGRPVTQGNHRWAKHGKAYEATRGHDQWRADVTWMARQAWGRRPRMDCAVALTMEFFVEPTKKAKPGDLPDKTGGDVSKLARSVEDSLEDAGVYINDRRITDEHTSRRFAFGVQPVGCKVTVGPATRG